MNKYLIKIQNQSFNVTAEDSDMAVQAANEYAQNQGILTGSAEMYLCGDFADGSKKFQIGSFNLEGYKLPVSWSEIKEVIRKIRDEARTMAAQCNYKVTRFRGTFLTVLDVDGERLICSGDGWLFPNTRIGWHNMLAKINSKYPAAKRVYVETGINGANSLVDMNEGIYEPWIGEGSALIYVY